MKAEEILRTAADLVSGPRKKQHGDVNEVFSRTSKLFFDMTGIDIHPLDCVGFMVCLKLARLGSKGLNMDNYIDACGYLALAGQLESEDK